MWPTVGRTLFETFTLDTVEGTSYIMADMETKLGDAWFLLLAVLSVVGIALFVLGVPLAYFFLLRRFVKHREPAESNAGTQPHWVERRFGSLFKQYEPAYWVRAPCRSFLVFTRH